MKKSLVILIIAALCLVLSCSVIVLAATPGSAEDPVVTKSYLDGVIAELKETKSAGSGEYIVLEKLAKDTIIVGGGSTEMILRSGAVCVYLPEGAGGGLSDLTAGSDLGNGKAVSKNHLILFPRNDGRAFKVTKDNTYVMVKGDYTLQ